jgi:hypothetical protein
VFWRPGCPDENLYSEGRCRTSAPCLGNWSQGATLRLSGAVLHAACSSPGAIHHLPVIAEMLVQAHAYPPAGQRVAQPRDLGRWIHAIRIEAPWVTSRDDFLPWDPRLMVRVPTRGVLRPVHPGWLRRPLDTLAMLGDYAECVDPVLIPELGFGLADVVDIGARMMEAERRALAPHWPADRRADWRAGAVVSADEVAAAATYLSTWSVEAESALLPAQLWVTSDNSLSPAERHQTSAALAWVTHDAAEIAAGTDWLMRGALFVRHGGKTVPVPAGVVLVGGQLAPNLRAEAGPNLTVLKDQDEFLAVSLNGGPTDFRPARLSPPVHSSAIAWRSQHGVSGSTMNWVSTTRHCFRPCPVDLRPTPSTFFQVHTSSAT